MSTPIEGSQESPSTEYQEPTASETQIETTDHSAESHEQTNNPHWGEVERLTGPNVYKLIQPHLAKADTEARERISKLNQGYTPWKALADQGITPDHVQQALGVVRQLSDPDGQVQVYESLRTFLEREGRLPSGAELQQEVENNEEEEVDPRDQQLTVLQQQQQAVMQFLQQQQEAQQQQQIQQEADSWADQEWKRITTAHPDLSKEDLADVAQILAAQTNRGEAPDLDRAVASFSAMRDRIRTVPRPGQLAPRVPSGPGGGTPSAGGIDPSSLSKDQRRDLVAQMLQQGKG